MKPVWCRNVQYLMRRAFFKRKVVEVGVGVLMNQSYWASALCTCIGRLLICGWFMYTRVELFCAALGPNFDLKVK